MMTPKTLKPGQGEMLRLLGEPRIFKVAPSENGGACLQFETSHAPGAGAPAHLHREEDEAFYILDGVYEFRVGGSRFVATSGAFAFVPRGTVHGFANAGASVGRMLITVTPGIHHERFFREADELTRLLGKPPEISQLLNLTEEYGWTWMEAPERER
jgi:quercetin dioxygenase-like cupin family protein